MNLFPAHDRVSGERGWAVQTGPGGGSGWGHADGDAVEAEGEEVVNKSLVAPGVMQRGAQIRRAFEEDEHCVQFAGEAQEGEGDVRDNVMPLSFQPRPLRAHSPLPSSPSLRAREVKGMRRHRLQKEKEDAAAALPSLPPSPPPSPRHRRCLP